MSLFDSAPITGDDIVDAARRQSGALGYKTFSYSNGTPSGVPKDHHFVADTLDGVGLGFGSQSANRPSIADWSNPSATIPGWQPIGSGPVQAGDVLATQKRIPKSWYHGGGQQLGIATGDGTSIGIVDNDRIGENQFGFLDGHNPTVWRSTQLSDNSGLNGSNTQPMGGAANQQQLFSMFNSYGTGPRDGKCRATGTCDITS